VCLVGAGPGDPDLLTVRAWRALRCAQVVVYDLLVSPAILALAPPGAELVCAGKRAGRHALRQEQTNELLLALARAGRRVVRLKGGDPFIFGRGGEEAEFLARHDVPFTVVPGITSASGASCYAGIPLTHRDCSQAIVFVTAHRRNGRVELAWGTLARTGQTLVIYMGIGAAGVISQELVRHGMAATTPAAVVEQATTPLQRIVVTTLAELPRAIEAEGVQAPGLIIIGEVVRLRAAPTPGGRAAVRQAAFESLAEE
jgi:uroporphyrin-III C-methyltransferase/precorrin-2 dehydrogenase/sirohydrochlorin ferrochelatase